MKISEGLSVLWTSALATCLLASVAQADAIPYQSSGTQNPISYTFNAASTGNLTAYFYGSTASFTESLGLLINGIDSGINGLNNKTTLNGTALDFGNVTKGDTLTFYIDVTDSFVNKNFRYFSDTSINTDGTNHVYSTPFSGDSVITTPGTYVGFEDLSDANGETPDYNYADEQFVFTNTATTLSAVPLPAAAPMFGAALLVLGLAGHRMKRKGSVAA